MVHHGRGAACLTSRVLYKEFQVFSFDPGFARAKDWPTLTARLTMMGTLALVTVVGLPTVGVVLMAAMLIVPGPLRDSGPIGWGVCSWWLDRGAVGRGRHADFGGSDR